MAATRNEVGVFIVLSHTYKYHVMVPTDFIASHVRFSTEKASQYSRHVIHVHSFQTPVAPTDSKLRVCVQLNQ